MNNTPSINDTMPDNSSAATQGQPATGQTLGDKLRSVAASLESKDFQILFFMPDGGDFAASTYEIYRHASLLQKSGHRTMLVTEKTGYTHPEWIEPELTADITHVPLEKNEITIAPQDWLIIPDSATWLMEQTLKAKFPCQRTVLCQTYDIALNALLPGITWREFGIDTALVTSKAMAAFYGRLFKGRHHIHLEAFTPAIPDYFVAPERQRNLTVSVVTRNVNDVQNKLIKPFYLRYPHYQWVGFQVISGLPRKEFAKKLSQNALVVWLDRIAAFGTLPLEAAMTETPLIGLYPDQPSDHISDETAIWVSTAYQAADWVARELDNIIQFKQDAAMSARAVEAAGQYRTVNADPTVLTAYGNLITKRIDGIKRQIRETQQAG